MMYASRLLSIFLFVVLISYGLYYTAEQITTVTLPTADDDTLLFSNQSRDDLTKVYLQSIDSAKHSILLLIYNLSDPSITHALRQKAEEGLNVTVICDGKASSKAKKYLGSHVKVYQRHDKGLMHLKILVVDEDLVVLGSANLSKHSLRIHGNLIMAFNSKEMASFVQERSKEVAIGINNFAQSHKEFEIGTQRVELWFLPNQRQAIDRIINLIDQAKRTIKIAMFTWTRRDFAEAVVRSTLRGLNVEVIIDRDSTKSASKKIARYLYRENVPTYINTTQGLLHHKFVVIDDSICVNGSANWTKAAFTKNNDCFVVLHHLTKQQLSVINSMWKTIQNESRPFKPRHLPTS
ncbi:MAG: phospholipase D-like domain-containing protein [Chlamydiota bacterium]